VSQFNASTRRGALSHRELQFSAQIIATLVLVKNANPEDGNSSQARTTRVR
jgi:hypothetical protein